MLPALLLVALTQAPPSLLIVRSANLGVPEARATELVEAVAELARREGMQVTVAPQRCGDRSCLLELARASGADAALSVSFAAVGRDAVMDLEGRETVAGASIAQLTFTVRANTWAQLVMEPVRLLHELKSALAETPPLPGAPQPKVVAPPPACPEPAPAIAQPAPSGGFPRSTVAWVSGALAFGSAVAGGVLLGVNAAEAGSLSRATRNGLLPADRIESAVAFDQRQQAAVGLLIGAGVLVVVALVVAWWAGPNT